MRKSNYHQIVGSTIKVIASADLDIEQDLQDNNNKENKTISELLDEQKEKEQYTTKDI